MTIWQCGSSDYAYRTSWCASAESVNGPVYQMDESMLPLGVALHVAVALEYFEQHQAAASDSHQEL